MLVCGVIKEKNCNFKKLSNIANICKITIKLPAPFFLRSPIRKKIGLCNVSQQIIKSRLCVGESCEINVPEMFPYSTCLKENSPQLLHLMLKRISFLIYAIFTNGVIKRPKILNSFKMNTYVLFHLFTNKSTKIHKYFFTFDAVFLHKNTFT